MSWVSPDSLDMLGASAALPEQLEAAASAAGAVRGLPSPEGLGAIVVVGMGASGAAGEILQAVGRDGSWHRAEICSQNRTFGLGCQSERSLR